MENKYQNVYITTSDGKTYTFTGKAVFNKSSKNPHITGIKFSEPMDLPNGVYFEERINGK